QYNVSKAAAMALTRQMAYELAAYGIRVNALAPGLTETDMNRHDLADESFRTMRLGRIPLGFIGTPEDQVGAALFLLSDAARYITGACIHVDGGNSLMGPAIVAPRV
ncbi:MAG TPA: SDR family oxidoreductase, partial [Candidatus Limnocylindria bacterium]|nr:SDR family oxidoreductase [Candidatus Limnocylindria bacterium]